MNHSESITKIAPALVKAQAEIGLVPFNSTNPFLKNRYADLGAILEVVKPILAKHELAVIQLAETTNYHLDEIETQHVVVETILLHSSGEYISTTINLPIGDEKGKSNAQVAGSIITYLRRYALASALSVYSDEDTDGNKPAPANNTHQPAPAQQPARRPTEQVIADMGFEPKPKPKTERPLDADTLRDVFVQKAAQSGDYQASEKQRGLLHALLDQIFTGDDEKYRTWLWFMFDATSSKDLTGAEVKALIDWMKPTKDSGGAWVIDPMAQREASQSVQSAMVERAAHDGQQTLI